MEKVKRYRLIDVLRERMTLIVSLPENDLDTALMVEAAGADAIKVHLNCLHRASGTHFLSWEEERKKIEHIPSRLSIPVGIVPGAEKVATLEEMEIIRGAGFDFLDIFAHHIPCPYLDIRDMTKVVATDYRFPPDHVPHLAECGVDVIESSIINPEEYGTCLTIRDLCAYRSLIRKTICPVFVPTQRKIKPADIPHLRAAGASGIAIGAVVTGKKKEDIVAVTREFREAIDALKALPV
jgi:hypothetical protein